MFKVKLEEPIMAPREAPPPQLPIPMPETPAEAKTELALCEDRQDWSRAAALRYAAIPWLEQRAHRKPAPQSETKSQSSRRPQPTAVQYEPVDMPPWVVGGMAVFFWLFIGIPIMWELLIALLTPMWGPIVTVRRGPADHTGCLELYMSIAIGFFGIAPVWAIGTAIGEWLRKK